MNQFRLDLNATRCAQAHQDAHCGKMLLELVQQLCTGFPEPPAHRLPLPERCSFALLRRIGNGCTWRYLLPDERLMCDLLPYARTKAQYSNPVCVWTRATRANFDSTIALAQALAVEFRHRFGKPHGSEAALDWVVRHRAEAQVPNGPLQPFALAMPDPYLLNGLLLPTTPDSAVTAYRAYYRAEKRGHWRKVTSRNRASDQVWVPAKWTKRDPPEWF